MKDYLNAALQLLKLTAERLLILALGLMCVYLALSNQRANDNWEGIVLSYKEQNNDLQGQLKDERILNINISKDLEHAKKENYALRDSTAVMFNKIATALKIKYK